MMPNEFIRRKRIRKQQATVVQNNLANMYELDTIKSEKEPQYGNLQQLNKHYQKLNQELGNLLSLFTYSPYKPKKDRLHIFIEKQLRVVIACANNLPGDNLQNEYNKNQLISYCEGLVYTINSQSEVPLDLNLNKNKVLFFKNFFELKFILSEIQIIDGINFPEPTKKNNSKKMLLTKFITCMMSIIASLGMPLEAITRVSQQNTELNLDVNDFFGWPAPQFIKALLLASDVLGINFIFNGTFGWDLPEHLKTAFSAKSSLSMKLWMVSSFVFSICSGIGSAAMSNGAFRPFDIFNNPFVISTTSFCAGVSNIASRFVSSKSAPDKIKIVFFPEETQRMDTLLENFVKVLNNWQKNKAIIAGPSQKADLKEMINDFIELVENCQKLEKDLLQNKQTKIEEIKRLKINLNDIEKTSKQILEENPADDTDDILANEESETNKADTEHKPNDLRKHNKQMLEENQVKCTFDMPNLKKVEKELADTEHKLHELMIFKRSLVEQGTHIVDYLGVEYPSMLAGVIGLTFKSTDFLLTALKAIIGVVDSLLPASVFGLSAYFFWQQVLPPSAQWASIVIGIMAGIPTYLVYLLCTLQTFVAVQNRMSIINADLQYLLRNWSQISWSDMGKLLGKDFAMVAYLLLITLIAWASGSFMAGQADTNFTKLLGDSVPMLTTQIIPILTQIVVMTTNLGPIMSKVEALLAKKQTVKRAAVDSIIDNQLPAAIYQSPINPGSSQVSFFNRVKEKLCPSQPKPPQFSLIYHEI